MNTQNFMLGMGLGVMAGAAAAMTMMPQQKKVKKAAEKAVRSMGDAVQNFTQSLDM